MHTLSLGQATRGSSRFLARAIQQLERSLPRVRRFDSPALVLVAEVSLAALSYGLVLLLFGQQRGIHAAIEIYALTAVFAIAFRLAATMSAQLYRRSLRYASALDVISIAKAVSMSSVLFCVFTLWRFARLKIPVAVFVADAAFVFLLWSALHFGARLARIRHATARKDGKRALIVGAGDAGMAVLKELALDPASPCLPVAIVDDDPRKWRRSLYGVPVLGGTKALTKIAADTRADEILICIPSATHSQMHDILDASRRSSLPVQSLPSLAEVIRRPNGAIVSRRDLRNPRIEDLLQRDEVQIDPERTRELVGGKTVLITGAGGSIGSELCRQIAQTNPRKLVLVDKSENSLFYAQLESSERLGKPHVRPYLADIVDRDRTQSLLLAERPEIVFHAAAHKHVAMLELHPEEAIRNNVLGTRNVAEASLAAGVARFVNISTDKAVAPRNYMGLSKKLTELCVQSLAATAACGGTRFSNVRFGNVAGSTGSVFRLFWDQIQRGGPIRVTDPRATRYFMSVPEAVHLVLRAAALGHGGETFVLDMGEPLNIYELAKTMTLFAGLKPDVDIPIEFTGLRQGEKLTELLWEEWEQPVPAASDRIFEIRERKSPTHRILARIARMEQFLDAHDTEGLLQYLDDLFPSFRGDYQAACVSEGAAAPIAEPV